MRIKKGDTVLIISGKEKGREGKVLKVFPKEEQVLVEGINLKKRHRRPRRAGEKGSIVNLPRPLALSKVMPHCPHCGKGVRVGFKVRPDGSKFRVCKKCGGEF